MVRIHSILVPAIVLGPHSVYCVPYGNWTQFIEHSVYFTMHLVLRIQIPITFKPGSGSILSPRLSHSLSLSHSVSFSFSLSISLPLFYHSLSFSIQSCFCLSYLLCIALLLYRRRWSSSHIMQLYILSLRAYI